jgi:hypothetical protein
MTNIKEEVTLKDFCPWNTWEKKDDEIEDKTTGRHYHDENLNLIRAKCLAAFIATPIFQLFLFMPANICYRVLRVVTLYPLWSGGETSKKTFTARLGVIGMDLLRIVSSPLCLIGMMFAALLGATLSPLDGRKLFATFERFQYEFFNRDYVFFPIVNNILIPIGNLFNKDKIVPESDHSDFPPCGFAPCFQPLSDAKVVHLLGGRGGW